MIAPLTSPRRSTTRGRSAPPAEAPARRSLLAQIAHLEADLAGLQTSAWPRLGVSAPPAAGRSRAPRLLSLEQLEGARDDLVRRTRDLQRALEERGEAEEGYRRLKEEMLLAPEEHPWVRVSNADLGEPGCRHWHVLPRGGMLGRLAKWWRVRISSGCP